MEAPEQQEQQRGIGERQMGVILGKNIYLYFKVFLFQLFLKILFRKSFLLFHLDEN